MSEESLFVTTGKYQKIRLAWILKLAFTVLLLTLAFRNVQLESLAKAWGQVHPGWAIGTLFFYVPLCVVSESARLWAAGKRVAATPLSIREWSMAFLVSRPWFYMLPASAGADGMIWYRLRRKGWTHGECVFAVLSIRMWGLAVWALIAGLTLVVAPETRNILAGAPSWILSPWLWLSGGGVALAVCSLAPHWLARKEHVKLHAAGPDQAVLNLSLTLSSAFMNAACVWMAGHAAGLAFSLPVCLGLLAWLTFAMALPISLGGLGLQEALVLRLGLPLSLSIATLLAFSVIVHLMRAVLALAGGLAGLLYPDQPVVGPGSRIELPPIGRIMP